MPLLDVVRRPAEQAGRDPAMVELILGCPGALPNSGSDPRAAVEERIARGAGRLALPVTAFLPDLETALARSDFLSLHLPMSRENHHLMNRERFAKIKKGAMLINTARGPLVNEADLVEALKSRKVAAAGLDVFEVEPLPLSSPLLALDNVLVSGHVAGLDDDSAYDTSRMCAEIIVGLTQGKWPEGCVQNLKSGHVGWKW